MPRLALLGALVLSSLSAHAYVQQSGTALVMGLVVDSETDRPIGGVVVTIAPNQKVRTDGQGRFVFTDLPPGTYTITAEKPGYAEGAYGRRRPAGPIQTLSLATGERVADLKLALWKHSAITGTIIDDIGEPIVDLPVRAMRRTFIAGRSSLVPSSPTGAKTDDRGIYRFDGLTPGEYVVVVPAPRPEVAPRILQDARPFVYSTQYYPAAQNSAQAARFVVPPGTERSGIDLQLKLVATARVSGVAIGPDGPVSVGLALAPDSDEFAFAAGLETARTQSDAAGRFVFPAVPSGRYLLRASMLPPGPSRGAPAPTVPAGVTLWATQPVAVENGDVADVAVTLRAGFRVSGRFEFDDDVNRPAADVARRIMVTFETADGRPMPSVTTARGVIDTSYQFSSYQLPPGAYFLRTSMLPPGWTLKSAVIGGHDISSVPLDLTRDTPGVVITLTTRPTVVSGRVLSAAGVTDPSATVLIFPSDPGAWINYGGTPSRVRSIRAEKDGAYRIAGLPVGDYLAVAIPDAAVEDWQDPRKLQSFVSTATKFSLGEREALSLDLRTTEVPR